MKFFEQKLKGVYLIEAEPFRDHRGLFRRNFCPSEFAERGLMTHVRQCNVSENNKAATLRGFHCRQKYNPEHKVLSCIRGEIFDVVIDLREDSDTYLQTMSVNLSEENRRSLYIPANCANAWLTLRDKTWILYYHSEIYSPVDEFGIRYDDPLFGIEWPCEPKYLSEKDSIFPNFQPTISG